MVDFPTFYQIWADRMKWTVPRIHWLIIAWLNDFGPLGCLRAFRGCGKSTIIDVWMAYEVYRNNCIQTLLQSCDDPSALKSSRDVQNILRQHPLTKGMFVDEGTVESWFTYAGKMADPRNPQFFAKGIMSTVTGARASLIVNDDVEVPKNITTAELREKLQFRLSEQIYIAVPGVRKLFVGTPHTVETLYQEVEDTGANCLTIPLFADSYRIEDNRDKKKRFFVGFRAVNVFRGIGKTSAMLRPYIDYKTDGDWIEFFQPPEGLIDVYGVCAWPERFDKKELRQRRKETKTIGYWDSQYMLRAAVIHESRLNPEWANEYNCEISFRFANGDMVAYLGGVQLVGSVAYWDVATGKINSDDSVLSLMLTDERGHNYWHLAEGLEGDLAEFDERDQIIGGQVIRIRELCRQFNISHIQVEVNGVGSFAATLLRRALRGMGIGVTEKVQTQNKQERILESMEGPLTSGTLWMHTRVCDSPAWAQMRDFNPLARNAADDYLDSGSGAIKATPIRIAARHVGSKEEVRHWNINSGTGTTHNLRTSWD